MANSLTVGKLKAIIREAEIASDIDDSRRVYITRNGIALEAEVTTSDLSHLPDGRPIVVYGLIFAVAGEETKRSRG